MILVTGSSGLLGSHILYDLIGKRESVRAVYRSERRKNRVKKLFEYYNKTLNQFHNFEDVEWYQADVMDIDALEESFSGVQKVIHCAALVSFHKLDFHRCMTINRTGTENVVNLCLKKKVHKLCYISSTAALGSYGNPITEKTRWEPGKEVSGYSVSKYSAEKEAFRGAAEGLNTSIVNPCLIIGPGNWHRSSLTILKAGSKGMKYYPPGGNAIVDARDVSNIVLKLLYSEESGEKYLTIGHNLSFKDLLGLIAKSMNQKAPTKKLNKTLAYFTAATIENIYRIFRKRSPISIESIQSAYKTLEYSNEKVKKRFDYEFHTLEDTMDNAIKGRFND
ncbi:MAG: NAD-dependent epimerase/dehydratase family protein [Crocinitomicaceae bacterium]|nr:NAD-dependent epimerase/dehydratase family protein [Crocinitomicaceae bacterium]